MNIYAAFVEPGQFCRILTNGETSRDVYLVLDAWVDAARFANIRTGETITLPDDAMVQEMPLDQVAQFLLFNS